MLTRLEVRDWFTLGHFEATPGRLAVMLPGPGKDPTDPLDIVDILRQLVVEGCFVTKMFPRRSMPEGRSHFYQSFELELRGEGGAFRYELIVQQHRHRDNGARVDTEELWHDDVWLATYLRGALVVDEFGGSDTDSNLPEHADSNFSAFTSLDETHDPRFAAFKQQLARVHLLRVEPPWRLPGAPEPTAEQLAVEAAEQVAAARALLQRASELLRDRDATVCLVLPDAQLELEELRAWLTPTVDAVLAGRFGQLMLYTVREALYGPLAAQHGVQVVDKQPPPRPPQPAKKGKKPGPTSPQPARPRR